MPIVNVTSQTTGGGGKTISSRDSFTVGSGKDYADLTSLEAAIQYTIFDRPITITIDPGSYAGVTFENIQAPKINFVGNDIELSGCWYSHNFPMSFYTTSANSGSGTPSISSAGDTITITATGGNPDFIAGGVTAGTKIMTRTGNTVLGQYTVLSTPATNQLQLTAPAPVFGTNYDSVVIQPAIEINTANLYVKNTPQMSFSNLHFEDVGLWTDMTHEVNNMNRLSFWFSTGGPSYCPIYNGRTAGRVEISNANVFGEFLRGIMMYNPYTQINATQFMAVPGGAKTGTAMYYYNNSVYSNLCDVICLAPSTNKGANGLNGFGGSSRVMYNVIIINYDYSVNILGSGQADFTNCLFDTGINGLSATCQTYVTLNSTTIQNFSNLGTYVAYSSAVQESGCTYAGNATDRSPAVSGVEGNYGGYIKFP